MSPLDCQAACDSFTDLLAGDLSVEQAEAVQAHVNACEACGKTLADEQRTWAVMGEWQVEDAAPDVAPALRQALAPRPRWGRFAAGLFATAAAFYIVFAVIPVLLAGGDDRLSSLYPRVPMVVRPDGASPLEPEQDIVAGAQPCDIRLPDGTTLLLAEGARLRVRRPAPGVRFECALESGSVEIEAAHGGPIRVNALGGYVESVGTRFCVSVKREPSAESAWARVLQGRVRVECGGATRTLGPGETWQESVLRGEGELVGRLVETGKRRALTRLVPGWRVATMEYGKVWLRHAGKAPAAPRGRWLRVRYEVREGGVWVREWEALAVPPTPADCSPRVGAATLRTLRYRTLCMEANPSAVLAAAREAVREKDALAAPRIERARLRMTSASPDVAAELERCLKQLPKPPPRGGGLRSGGKR